MTDKEIIKALECCVSDKFTCRECAYEYDKHFTGEEYEIMPNGKTYDCFTCDEWLKLDLLDLIKRQQAEIERLTINMNAFGLGMKREKEKADIIRAEAIKEFAKRLKDCLAANCERVNERSSWSYEIIAGYQIDEVEDCIDNLVAKMTESESRNEENQT